MRTIISLALACAALSSAHIVKINPDFDLQDGSSYNSPYGPELPLQPFSYCSGTDSFPSEGLVGNLVGPANTTQELKDIYNSLNVSNIQYIVEKLVSFGNRNTLSSQTNATFGIGAARDWIHQTMLGYAERSNGTMVVSVPSYIQQPDGYLPVAANISDIIATITGSEDPNRVYLISGHYDSRNSDNFDTEERADGADDDASGVAVSMELARVMATLKPRATIILATVAGEEQGLYGSTYLAQTLYNNSVDVQGMFTNDIVGTGEEHGLNGLSYPYHLRLFVQGIPTLDANATTRAAALTEVGGENDSPARQLSRFVVENCNNKYTEMNVSIVYRADRYLRGGDHESFLQAGYLSAGRFTEPVENKLSYGFGRNANLSFSHFSHQHQNFTEVNGTLYGDRIEYVDFEYISRVAKVNAAALWTLANAPGTPKNVTIDTTTPTNETNFQTALSNFSVLKWLKSNETSLAGYEVVYRPTIAPYWTHVVDVGLDNEVRLEISKDNVEFGVRSYSTDGYRSPAAYAFPTPE